MPKKRDSGIVGLVTGVSARFHEAEEKLTELESAGKHLQKNLPKLLQDIEGCETTISESDERIAELQASRDELRNEYMEASFSGDTETERAIKAERTHLDKQLEQHVAERDKAQTNLNRLRSNLNTTREDAYATLDEITVDDTDGFLEAFIDALREQTEQLQKRMYAAQLLYELPEETEVREVAERQAERQREARQRSQEKRERSERRRVLSRLLAHESVSEPRRGNRPRRGSESWKLEAKRRGIELPRYDNLPVTAAEFELYRLVEAEYVQLRKADGLSVAEESNQPKEYGPEDFARNSGYISVM